MNNIYNRILFFLFLLLGVGLSAQQIEDDLHLLDSLLDKHKNMHFYQSPTIGRCDSVWHRTEQMYLYFDTDSICRQFVRKGGYNAIPDEMDYLYFTVFTELTHERRAIEIKKMEKVAKAYQSDALMREMELQTVSFFPYDDDSDQQFDYRLKCLRGLLQKANRQKDVLLQIRIREVILSGLRYRDRRIETLEEAVSITKILDSITDQQYVARRNLYFFIGEIYYLYGYYEQAISLLKKALKDANYFFERSNLRARNNLGLYYRDQGNLDLSDHYFRSMLESPDQVKYRGEYDAIAIVNLAKNCLIRNNYPKAEPLLQKGLSVMRNFDPVFSARIYINLANCYLAKGKWSQTKAMIDSAQKLIISYHPHANDLKNDLYPLMTKYYAATGDTKASMAYTDSIVKQYIEYQKHYNISHIFRVEKKLYEAEKKTNEKQLKIEKMKAEKYRNILVMSLLLILLVIVFYILYARIRRKKNRMLYKRIIEANRAKTNKNPLLQRLEKLMQTELLFTHPDLNRKELANRLFTNEKYLIHAIREEYNGQTFSDYINSLRLIFACQLLQNNSELSIKEILTESGFSSYKYFHQLFYEKFGMSPSDFKKISKEQREKSGATNIGRYKINPDLLSK